ncbi:TPA: hypothetical protein ACH3X3_004065 [Trebouxia sp. C0006]
MDARHGGSSLFTLSLLTAAKRHNRLLKQALPCWREHNRSFRSHLILLCKVVSFGHSTAALSQEAWLVRTESFHAEPPHCRKAAQQASETSFALLEGTQEIVLITPCSDLQGSLSNAPAARICTGEAVSYT